MLNKAAEHNFCVGQVRQMFGKSAGGPKSISARLWIKTQGCPIPRKYFPLPSKLGKIEENASERIRMATKRTV
eukprot:1843783-Ditylum_brightwellii.AAC.1